MLGTKNGPRCFLVAISTQCINDCTREIWLEDTRAAQLANLLCRLGDCQVASSALAVLNFAGRCQTESLFRGLVRLLLGHIRILQGQYRAMVAPILGRWDGKSPTQGAESLS